MGAQLLGPRLCHSDQMPLIAAVTDNEDFCGEFASPLLGSESNQEEYLPAARPPGGITSAILSKRVGPSARAPTIARAPREKPMA